MTVRIHDMKSNVKTGAIAGHIAAWSIFGLIFLIDGLLGLKSGTFYRVIGLALGSDPSIALYLGFILHMLTGTVIGALFGYVTSMIKVLNITSVKRAFSLAIMTGLASWLVLFLPLTLFVVKPSMQTIVSILGENALPTLTNEILVGAIGMHILYGWMLGLMYYLGTVTVHTREYELADMR